MNIPSVMTNELQKIKQWYTESRSFVIATVIKTWGSAPRIPGSLMAISDSGEIVGSVSGGCVEGDVIRNSKQVFDSDETIKITYGVTNEDAWTVGLTCGGKLEVWIEKMWKNEFWNKILNCLEAGNSCALATDGKNQVLLADSEFTGHTPDRDITDAIELCLAKGKPDIVGKDENTWFVNVFSAKSQLIIIGAAHISAHLVQLGSLLGFETIIIDPRGLFADKQQFAVAPDRTFKNWPAEVLEHFNLDKNTFVVLLTHDPKIDDQALHILLKSGVAYIGALGSSKTQQKRAQRLKNEGFTDDDINRISGPVGLNIHARLPEEIALSIISEIIKVKNE